MKLRRYPFDIIDSTNSWAKKNVQLFDSKEMVLITANEQTHGRGQFNRKWVSPSGKNIYATFCFFLPISVSDLTGIPLVLADSLIETLKEYGLSGVIKLPNDVFVSGKKIAGILCETTPVDHLRCIMLGIGVNVNMERDLLNQIDQPATSIFAETGKKYAVQEVLERLTKNFMEKLKKE